MSITNYYKAWLLFLVVLLPLDEVSSQLPLIERTVLEPLQGPNDPTTFCYKDLVLDQKGRLWMKTCGVAQQLYDVRVFQFDGYDRWPIAIAQGKWQNYQTIYLDEFSSDGQWLGYFTDRKNRSTLFAYDVQSESIQYTDVPSGICVSLAKYEDDKYWILSRHGSNYQIYLWDTTSVELRYSFPNSVPPELQSDTQGEVNFEYADSTFWIMENKLPLIGYHTRIQTAFKFERAELFKSTTAGVAKLANLIAYTTIISKDSMVYIAHPVSSIPFLQINNRKLEDGAQPIIDIPTGVDAKKLWKDQQGNLLFMAEYSEQTRGIFKAYLLDKQNRLFDYTPMFEGLSKVRSVQGKNFKKSAYVGTSKGAFFIQAKSTNGIETFKDIGGLRHIVQHKSGAMIIRSSNRLYVLDNDQLSMIPKEDCFTKSYASYGRKELLCSPDGTAWVKSEQYLTPFVRNKQRDCINYAFDFPLGTSIFLSESTLVIIEEHTKKLILYDLEKQQQIPLPGPGIHFQNRVHSLHCTPSNILWVASNAGLYKVNLSTGVSKLYGSAPDFEDHRILSIIEDDQGKLWLGTTSRGIHIFNPKTEKVELVVNEVGGLSNNVVVGLLQDNDGDIWAATYNGLNLLKPDGSIVTVLDEKEGLTHHEFNRYSHFKSDDGRLWFGALKGLNIIQPETFKKELQATNSTKIFVTSLSYFDHQAQSKVQLRNYINRKKPFILSADKRYLSINVGMSNYGQNAKNRYAYRLEGRQNDWTYLGLDHAIRLTSLPAGKYNLLIKGIDQNGNWTANTIQIPIYAKEFFYKQWWFYLLCAMPFLIFAFLWIRRLRSEKYRLEHEVEKRTEVIRQDKELIQQQAEELQQLDKMKSRFFANISHDLRTPITLIAGPAELLAEEEYVKQKSVFHKAILTIGQNSKKLLRLVDEFLDLARLESKTVQLHEESVSLLEFLQTIFDSYTLAAQRKKLQFEFAPAIPVGFQLVIDPKRLEKIINNLLSNALKFTAPGDSIQLRVFQEHNQILFEVQDTGRGIPPEDLPHVFERFFQSKSDKLVQTSGSGLGLSICQDFAQLMGGQLTASSNYGQSSTFRLSLPMKEGQLSKTSQTISKNNSAVHTLPSSRSIVTRHPSSKPPTPQTLPPSSVLPTPPSLPTPKPQNSPTPKLMIVEDNPEVQSFLELLLQEDYQVQCFDDGQYALEFLQRQKGKKLPVDLILSDINMPRLDGYGLIKAIKENEQWQQLPMVMLTARLQERSKLKALRMGVDDYLTKPFSPIELKVRLKNIYDNYQKRLVAQKEFLEVNPEFEPTASADQLWLKELEEHALHAIDKQIELTMNLLAEKMALSPRQLSRKVKLITGLTIGKYIHEIKLQKARHLLEQKAYPTVAEVGYACGFNSQSYFTKIFHRHFGRTPTSYY
ncbi:MAG: ATP-binding protein [Bacteroidota bacterium]